jgi:hypothetical protein
MFIHAPTNDYCHTLILQSNKNLTGSYWVSVGSEKIYNLRAGAQCEIHIQQKFFPNAAQLEFNGKKIVVKVLLFERSFSSNEQTLVQKLFFVHSRIDQLSYRPARLFVV